VKAEKVSTQGGVLREWRAAHKDHEFVEPESPAEDIARFCTLLPGDAGQHLGILGRKDQGGLFGHGVNSAKHVLV
jgi:hypothetical protein